MAQRVRRGASLPAIDRVGRKVLIALAIVLTAITGAASCSRSASPTSLPAVEFLLAAGDSTYWVRSTPQGVRVRSAPILVTVVGGRFYELYVAEDGVDFDDAEFVTARLWSRDLLTRDSTLLLADSTVQRVATTWKGRHPGESPIHPGDDMLSDDPGVSVSSTIDITDVHDRYVSFTAFLDVDTDRPDEHEHAQHRGVVDLTTGRGMSLQSLFGDDEGRRVESEAFAGFGRLMDSIRTAGDERAFEARRTLDSFHLDALGFSVTDVQGVPAASFMLPGNDSTGASLALYLAPIVIRPPGWWTAVGRTLPVWSPDSTALSWAMPTYRVRGVPTDAGERVSVSLGKPGQTMTRFVSVPAPAYQLIPLDGSLDRRTRDAIARAFNSASTTDGLSQQVAYLRP